LGELPFFFKNTQEVYTEHSLIDAIVSLTLSCKNVFIVITPIRNSNLTYNMTSREN